MRDIKIADAKFFPNPQAIYKEQPIEKIMGSESKEYIKAWTFNGLLIFASVAEYDDGNEWLHLSFSRKSKIPTYDEMTRIKRDFIGEDKKAIMVLPEKKNYVNLAKNCLHLFYSEKNPLPEFSNGWSI